MAEIIDKQVLYLGRWVSREHFRAFVYNSTGNKLAKSYHEFSEMISSGIWFAEPKDNYDEAKIEAESIESNVVDIKPKRGKKCPSQRKA